MFPKHTQLQNSTLTIHTPISTVSPSTGRGARLAVAAHDENELCAACHALDGAGITSGLTPSSSADPVSPTQVDSRKPGMLRSMSHHRSGFTRASVAETCSVEAHASLRCACQSVSTGASRTEGLLSQWQR